MRSYFSSKAIYKPDPSSDFLVETPDTLSDQFVFRTFDTPDAPPARHPGKMGGFALFGLLFSLCVGSGYGFEDAVGSAGPLVCIIVGSVLNWIWTFPTGLVVAEMSSAMPSNAGSTVWINAAFHPVVSCYNILTTCFMGMTANASYVALTANYFERVVAGPGGQLPLWGRIVTKIGAMLISTTLNIIGVEVVGGASFVMAILTLVPFVALAIVSFVNYPFDSNAVTFVPTGINWPVFLSIISFNYCNIDAVGSVIEDVEQPQKNLFRAMIPLMFSYYLAYVIPVTAAVSALAAINPAAATDYSAWVDGYWATAARLIGGTWLRWVMLAGAIIAGNGYLLTGLCTSAQQAAGMAEIGSFPRIVNKFLATTNRRFGTHVNSILVMAVTGLALALAFDFESLVALQQVMYALRLVLIYMSMIKMRIVHPTLKRPFRFPIRSTPLLIVALLPATMFSLLNFAFGMQLDMIVLYTVVGVLAGLLLISFVLVRFMGFQCKGGVVRTNQPFEEETESHGHEMQ